MKDGQAVLRNKFMYFVLALAAPEYFVSIAIRDWKNAHDLTITISTITEDTTDFVRVCFLTGIGWV